MERRQAVHEDGVRGGHGHDFLRHAVGLQELDALGPELGRLAHGHPDVGVDDVGARAGLLHVLGQRDGGAGLGGNLAALGHEIGLRHTGLGAAGHEVQAQLRAHDHERVRHVVLGVAHEHELQALEALREVLLDRQHVGDHLRGMELGGQAVPHRHAGVGGQVLDDLLGEAAVLDAVVHAAEHAGGVLDGLLLAHLGAAGIEVGDAHAEVHAAHLERAARAGGGLLEQQDDVLAFEVAMGGTRQFQVLELLGQLDEVADLVRREIQQLQEVASAQARGHDSFLSSFFAKFSYV